MKNKLQLLFLGISLVLGVLLLTRPCIIRPFQNKSCYECGTEEGEKQALRDIELKLSKEGKRAVEDWNNNHNEKFKVNESSRFINQ